MSDVFISYSRKDIAFARILHEALLENGFETWIDWQDIPPSADWLAEVYEAIEQADTFIFIISDHSVISDVCGLEIEHAKSLGKRVIPIVINEIESQKVPAYLTLLNWIFFRDDDEFSKPLQSLLEALQTDLSWVKTHTRYLNRALEWQRQARDPGVLLRGGDLGAAEDWLTKGRDKDPPPTALQNEFITVSRQETSKRQRRTLLALVGIFAVTVILGIISWSLRNTAIHDGYMQATAEAAAVAEAELRATAQYKAEEQRAVAVEMRNTALSRKLASDALNHLDQLDLALLLSVEASKFADTNAARASLLSAFMHRPELMEIRHTGLDSRITAIAISEDMKTAAFAAESGFLQLWNWEDNHLLNSIDGAHQAEIIELRLTSSGDLLVSLDDSGIVQVCGIKETNIELNHSLDFMAEDLVILSPNGSYIITANGDQLQRWDSRTGEKIGPRLRLTDWRITSMAHSTDDLYAVAYQNLETLEERIYLMGTDPENASLGVLLEMKYQEREITDLVFSKSGAKLFAIERNNPDTDRSYIIHTLDITSRQEKSWYWTHLHEFSGFTLDSTGERLLLISDEKIHTSIHEYDLSPGSHSLVSLPEVLVGADRTGSIYIWDFLRNSVTPFTRASYVWEDCPVKSLSLDWTRVITECPNDGTILWDIASNTVLARSEESINPNSIFSPDHRRLIDTGGGDCVIKLWDIETLEPLSDWINNVTNEVTFNRDSRLFAGCHCLSGDQAFYVWNAEGGELLDTYYEDPFARVDEMIFSPVEDLLVILGLDAERTATLWFVRNLEGSLLDGSGQPEISIVYQSTEDDPNLIHDLVFSPDGRFLAMSGRQEVKLFDVDSQTFSGLPIRAEIEPLSASDGSPPNRIAFSPDMKLLAVGDLVIQLIDLETHFPIGPAIPGRPGSIAFSPDGNMLAISSTFWDVSLQTWRQIACQIAGRNLTPEEWDDHIDNLPYHTTCENLP